MGLTVRADYTFERARVKRELIMRMKSIKQEKEKRGKFQNKAILSLESGLLSLSNLIGTLSIMGRVISNETDHPSR